MPCSEAEPLTEPEALQLLPRLAMQPVLSDFSALVLDGSGVTGSIIEWVCTQELYIGSKLEFSHVHCKHSSLSYLASSKAAVLQEGYRDMADNTAWNWKLGPELPLTPAPASPHEWAMGQCLGRRCRVQGSDVCCVLGLDALRSECYHR